MPMKKKILMLMIIFSIVISFTSYAEDEGTVDDGLPSLEKLLDTDKELLMSKSSRYLFDGEGGLFSINIFEMMGNLGFTIYNFEW